MDHDTSARDRGCRIGIIACRARLGDTVEALRAARQLDRAAGAMTGLKADALHTFARGVRAHVAGETNRAAEAKRRAGG